jgi:hypothetical protein
MSNPDPDYDKKPSVKKVMNAMAEIFKPPKCPKCGCDGRLKPLFLDMQFDKMVYQCTKCGTEFI